MKSLSILMMMTINIYIGLKYGYYVTGCQGNIGFAFMIPEISIQTCVEIPPVVNCSFQNITQVATCNDSIIVCNESNCTCPLNCQYCNANQCSQPSTCSDEECSFPVGGSFPPAPFVPPSCNGIFQACDLLVNRTCGNCPTQCANCLIIANISQPVTLLANGCSNCTLAGCNQNNLTGLIGFLTLTCNSDLDCLNQQLTSCTCQSNGVGCEKTCQ